MPSIADHTERVLAAATIGQAVRDVVEFATADRAGLETEILAGRKHHPCDRRAKLRAAISAAEFVFGGGAWGHWCNVLGLEPQRASQQALAFIADAISRQAVLSQEFLRRP
jgi:hypothetical protein